MRVIIVLISGILFPLAKFACSEETFTATTAKNDDGNNNSKDPKTRNDNAGYAAGEGFYQQKKPCFDVFHYPECDTAINREFTSQYLGKRAITPSTKVWLFTYDNPHKAVEVHKCGGQLPDDVKFDTEVDTIVVIHGYVDGVCRTAWMREFKSLFFKRSKYNVILIDWTWGNFIDIAAACPNAMIAGEEVGYVLQNLILKRKLKGDKIHLIGHSYGTVAVGSAGKFIKDWDEENIIKRITALDPPVIVTSGSNTCLAVQHTDAKFVDAIHSSSGPCFPLYIGTEDPVGHVDFYPNGGTVQPSCYSQAWNSIRKGDMAYGTASLFYPTLCDHLQAIQFFRVTINPLKHLVIGVKCDNKTDFFTGKCKRCCSEKGYDCAVAGMDAEKYYLHAGEAREKRRYYYTTSQSCPYEENYKYSIFKDCTSA